MPDLDHNQLIDMNTQLKSAWLADPNYGFDDFRAIFETWLGQFPIPAGTEFEDVDADGVPCIWADAPEIDNSRVVMHFHSGGYVMGSASGYRFFGGLLSAATGARVLLVDYRLAPDHAHPAAVDDALTAYRWLLGQGVEAGKIALSGDSAGGGLAMIALQQIRDAGLPLPGCTLALSPLADFTASGGSRVTNAPVDPLVTTDLLEALAATYCGDRDRTDPALSPLFGDWSGLSPLLVFAGDIEVFRDDGKLCVDAAKRAGVDAHFRVGAKMVHIYPIYADRLAEGRAALTEIGAFVRQHTGAAA